MATGCVTVVTTVGIMNMWVLLVWSQVKDKSNYSSLVRMFAANNCGLKFQEKSSEEEKEKGRYLQDLSF